MNSIGRPRALADEQKRRTLLAMISIGAGLESAARHVGCSTWTIQREAQRDEDFAQQLREAQTAAELTPLRMMRNAASSNWRAAAWLLERCYPERFARRKPEDVSFEMLTNLFSEVMTIFYEVCKEETDRQDFSEQLGQLQQRYLDTPKGKEQGPPRPKSDLEKFIEEFDRRQDEELAAFQNQNGHFSFPGLE